MFTADLTLFGFTLVNMLTSDTGEYENVLFSQLYMCLDTIALQKEINHSVQEKSNLFQYTSHINYRTLFVSLWKCAG